MQISSSVSTSPSEAFEVLRTCLSYRPAAARRDTLQSFVDTGLDWDVIRREAARHRVLPLVYRRLESLLGEGLPASVRETGREHRRGIRIRNTFLIQELGGLAECFDQTDLPFLVMKGPVLARTAYGDIALRHSVDADVFVPKEQFSEVEHKLQNLGYEYAEKRKAVSGWRKSLSLYLDGQWEFQRGRSFTLDVHTRLMPPGYSFPSDFQPFWKRAQPVCLSEEVTVHGFSVEDRLLVLAHHGIKNQWRALRHVADIAAVIWEEDDLDWERLLARAERIEATRALKLGLCMAHELLDVPLPPHVEEWSLEESMDEITASMKGYLRDRPEKSALAYWKRVRLQLATKDTLAGQLRYGAHSLLQHLWSTLLRP